MDSLSGSRQSREGVGSAIEKTGQRGEMCSQLHCPRATSGALLQRLARESLIKGLVVAGQRLVGNSGGCGSAEQGAAERQLVAAAAIGQESELAEALEAAG